MFFDILFFISTPGTPTSPYFAADSAWYLGCKLYEIGNHLGNVVSVISDRKQAFDTNADDEADYYEPVVLSATDYYPFGFEMPGRKYNIGKYRYEFNGKEADRNGEFSKLAHNDFGARIYNPALGRWLSTDPQMNKYANFSPYIGIGNNPILYTDPDGEDIIVRISWEWAGNDDGRDIYRPVFNVTVTGSVLNASNERWDVSEIAEQINSNGNYYLSGSVNLDEIDNFALLSLDLSSNNRNIPENAIARLKGNANVNFTFQFTGVESIDEVDRDDHLLVIGDFLEARINPNNIYNQYHALSRGVTLLNGGQIAILDGTNTSTNKLLARIGLHEFWQHMAKAEAGHSGGKLAGPGDVTKKWFFFKDNVVTDEDRAAFLRAHASGLTNLGDAFIIGSDAAGSRVKAIPEKISIRALGILRQAKNNRGGDARIWDAGVKNLRGVPISNRGLHEIIRR